MQSSSRLENQLNVFVFQQPNVVVQQVNQILPQTVVKAIDQNKLPRLPLTKARRNCISNQLNRANGHADLWHTRLDKSSRDYNLTSSLAGGPGACGGLLVREVPRQYRKS